MFQSSVRINVGPNSLRMPTAPTRVLPFQSSVRINVGPNGKYIRKRERNELVSILRED